MSQDINLRNPGQQKIFAREGINLPLSTLADWVGQCGFELQPLVDALRAEVLNKDVFHANETSYQSIACGTRQKDPPSVPLGLCVRRKFYELHVANKNDIAAQALNTFKILYAIEAEAKTLTVKQRQQALEEQVRPILEKLPEWMLAQRSPVPDGSGTAKALDYSLKCWGALTYYLEDGQVPINNNHIE